MLCLARLGKSVWLSGQKPISTQAQIIVQNLYFSSLSATRKKLKDLNMRQMFEDWIKEHRRVYKSPREKEWRFKIFRNTVHRVNANNRDPNRSSDAGVTPFADLLSMELPRGYRKGRYIRR